MTSAFPLGRLFEERRLPEIGERIADTYRVLELIGEGGMGVVYRARDEILSRDVAIKMVQPRWATKAHLRDRFVAEARAQARLTHANVIQVYALGEHDGLPFFVMEHVIGRTLEAVLEANGREPISPKQALPVIERVCDGLSAIHGRCLVHGDVKPGNVMLGDDGRVALMDMGLARLLDGTDTRVPGLWGTPAYIAPELATGQPVPASMLPLADVYAVATMTYEMLTGRTPFVTDDVEEMLRLHATAPVPPPSQVCPELDTAFDHVLCRALDADPTRRPQTADELAKALRLATEQHRARRGRLRFLVADDDHDHRALVARVLARTFPGAIVETCSDGTSALAIVDRRVPSLAILDLCMDGMNGIELVAALRNDPRTKEMPIVVLTGRGSGSDWQLLLRLGANRFAVKPMVTESFVATVRALLGLEDAIRDAAE
jgi:serine/threonine-protein kinase